MAREKPLTRAEVLKRMRAGDFPTAGGGYTGKLFFDDGRKTTSQMGSRLVREGVIERPGPWNGQSPTSVHSTYRLGKGE